MRQLKPEQPRRRHKLLNLLLAMVLLLLVAALLVIFLVNRPPGFYQPAQERNRQKLLDDAKVFCVTLQAFASDVLSERAQPLELTDDEVNGYLAAVNDPGIWDLIPIRFESWRKMFTSDWLRNVQVNFTEGRVTVSGEVTWHGFDIVLSVIGVPRCDGEGKARLHVTGIRAGTLPLPKYFFRDFLTGIDDRPIPARVSRSRLKSVDVKDGKAVLTWEIVAKED